MRIKPLTGYEAAESVVMAKMDSLYTIAYWTHDREGWNLRFVGDRMLELSQLHIEKVWPQLCAAQIMFEAWLKDQEEEY